jgi:iron-sulfur cluster assembly accessory protein
MPEDTAIFHKNLTSPEYRVIISGRDRKRAAPEVAHTRDEHHMTTQQSTDIQPITITPNAARRIVEVMKTESAGTMLRVSVSGGGCSGFQYVFGIDGQRQSDDILIERDGARVLVDEVSLPFIAGSTIDFVDDLIGQSFKVQNPNATAACGCGTSFAM